MLQTYTLNNLAIKDLAVVATSIKRFSVVKDVIALYGNLGAGKTTFCKEIFSLYGIDPKIVTSPTFNIVQSYDLKNGLKIHHFDLYRLTRPEEIYEVGFDDLRATGINFVEWPEKLDFYLPKDRLELRFNFNDNLSNRRDVSLIPHGNWTSRYENLLSSFNS